MFYLAWFGLRWQWPDSGKGTYPVSGGSQQVAGRRVRRRRTNVWRRL